MAEIYNEAVLESLKVQQRHINYAINGMVDYQRHGAKFTTSDKAAQIAIVKAASLAGGVDIEEWVGNPDPDPLTAR